jgi:hypothetical protein
MPELETEVTLDVPSAHMDFLTKQNGDRMIFSRLHLTAEQAATIAWLTNSKQVLSVQIKLKE